MSLTLLIPGFEQSLEQLTIHAVAEKRPMEYTYAQPRNPMKYKYVKQGIKLKWSCAHVHNRTS